MTHRLHHGLAFLAALAAGGGVAAALIGIGIAEVAAIVCGWAVFLILGTALGTAVTHRHRHS